MFLSAVPVLGLCRLRLFCNWVFVFGVWSRGPSIQLCDPHPTLSIHFSIDNDLSSTRKSPPRLLRKRQICDTRTIACHPNGINSVQLPNYPNYTAVMTALASPPCQSRVASLSSGCRDICFRGTRSSLPMLCGVGMRQLSSSGQRDSIMTRG